MTAPAPPLDPSLGPAHAPQDALAHAVATVLGCIAAQHSLLAEFEAISTSITEAARLDEPDALGRLMLMRQDLIERLELEIEASRSERSAIDTGRHLLPPATLREIDAGVASLRTLLASIVERDAEETQRLREIRDAASRELAEIAASDRALKGYGGPRDSGPTFQDRSA